jgi:CxxC motif-containing protein (DUF1111 family)
MARKILLAYSLVFALLLVTHAIQSENNATTGFDAQDPGVQTSNRGTGATLINAHNDPNGFLAFFNDGLTRFKDVETVSNSANVGLGPRFNSNQCSSCHANPQFQFVNDGIAPDNTTPSFITADGPTREVRFPFFLNSNGTANTSAPDGGVEDLFTVSGRPDAGSCQLSQPDFAAAIAANDIIFRIPTPLFGAGLIENLDDSTLMDNLADNSANNLGISGSFNRSGNDGTITRFGWKAQNKSLHVFSGEAYNVEMGITNELFPNERPLPEEELATGLPASCLNLSGNGYPEDTSNPTSTPNAAVLDDVSAFGNFARFLAPPAPGAVILNGSQVSQFVINRGSSLFSSVGCATCHTPTPGNTQVSNFTPALSKAPVHAFSDIALHHMGAGLADNVAQGNAGGDQFRTAPLWGLGQRIFLLHDGRTTNLLQAIEAHASNGSEANSVISNFNSLSNAQQQEILDFLRSL